MFFRKNLMINLEVIGRWQYLVLVFPHLVAHFAKQTPYIHLDIAGVAFFSKKQEYYNAGASGYAIRLLYAFLQTYDLIYK